MVADYTYQNSLTVSSAFVTQAETPLVTLTCGAQGFAVDLTPEAAQRLASQLMQCAEIAVNESLMVKYLQQHLGLEAKDARQALDLCRSWRERVYARY